MKARFCKFNLAQQFHSHIQRAAFAAFALSLQGCQQSEYADRRVEQRLASLDRTVKSWEQSEASRPQKLQQSFEFVGKEFEERQKKFDQNIRGAGDILAHDVKRFESRKDDYVREIWRVLWGKPEQIEKTAVDMFY